MKRGSIILFCSLFVICACESNSTSDNQESVIFTSDVLPTGIYQSSLYGKTEHLAEIDIFGRSKKEKYSMGGMILLDTLCIWTPVTSREAPIGIYYYSPSFDEGLNLTFIADSSKTEPLGMKKSNAKVFTKDLNFSVEKFEDHYLLKGKELELILSHHISFDDVKNWQ